MSTYTVKLWINEFEDINGIEPEVEFDVELEPKDRPFNSDSFWKPDVEFVSHDFNLYDDHQNKIIDNYYLKAGEKAIQVYMNEEPNF